MSIFSTAIVIYLLLISLINHAQGPIVFFSFFLFCTLQLDSVFGPKTNHFTHAIQLSVFSWSYIPLISIHVLRYSEGPDQPCGSPFSFPTPQAVYWGIKFLYQRTCKRAKLD